MRARRGARAHLPDGKGDAAHDDLPYRYRFHDLRHTGLTIFAQEGATLAELMRRGGHSDIRVVLRYQHSTMARDRELAERMSRTAQAKIEARKKANKDSQGGDGHL
ncbi:tyrosine-type recombinase/integrase [Nesterenkonia massiliensis]|uniref:tyrosine-type recombinase/integrase n=1 Tax=Nesterenkonia massiliensis TaxID=1232429 RepID=UPI0004109B8F|nr:tyrosine-type recombinase/integrase [Nesterenkonia massiliensis]